LLIRHEQAFESQIHGYFRPAALAMRAEIFLPRPYLQQKKTAMARKRIMMAGTTYFRASCLALRFAARILLFSGACVRFVVAFEVTFFGGIY
jgi:hypothetical protein